MFAILVVVCFVLFLSRNGNSNVLRIEKENRKSPWTHLIQYVKFKTCRVESWCISGFSRKGVCLINRITGMYGEVPVKTRHKVQPSQVRQMQP